MKVILLAAGVGRRFGKRTEDWPKCLIPLNRNGQTLLSRYLESFRELGLCDIVIVTGHHSQKIRKACAVFGDSLAIRFLFNRAYKKGSIVSLFTASKELNCDSLIMDADVYFPTKALKKLLDSKHKTCFLADTASKSAGEEMMLMAKGKRLWRISKNVDPDLKILGEATGIFKISKADVPILRKILKSFIQKKILNVEYEKSYQVLMRKVAVGVVDIGNVFWTEMDFEEDLEKIKKWLRR